MTLQEIKDLDFETAYKQLTDTAEKLEKGNLSLEESLALYEEGMYLAQHCGMLLDKAELRVSQVMPGFTANPFDEDDD